MNTLITGCKLIIFFTTPNNNPTAKKVHITEINESERCLYNFYATNCKVLRRIILRTKFVADCSEQWKLLGTNEPF